MIVATLVVLVTAVSALVGVLIASHARTRGIAPGRRIQVRPGAFLALVEREVGRLPMPKIDSLLVSGQLDEAGFGASSSEWTPSSPQVENAAVWGAAVADGALPGIDVWARWSSVDHHVFQAVAHLTRQQVDGFADLLRVVEAKHYALASRGFFSLLKGHVAEWHAMEHFASAGAAVNMSTVSNQAGVDMLIGEHPVDVKAWADAGAAAGKHFGDYPHIAMVVPHDVAHIPADALHFDPTQGFDASVLHGADHLTIVDRALSHADVADQTGHAIDVLQDAGPHAHFPWVTVAVATFREGRLLVNGSTDLSRAAKNVAVDAATVGGGAAVGMKAGGLVGSIFGPVGIVVGGLAGSMAGAIGGRMAGNAVKRGPLNEAKTAYEQAVSKYTSGERAAITYAGVTWTDGREAEQTRFRGELDELARRKQAFVDALRARLREATFLTHGQAATYLDEGGRNVDVAVQVAHEQLRAEAGVFGKVVGALVAPEAYVDHRALSADARKWHHQARLLLEAWPGDERGTRAVFDLLLAAPGGEGPALTFVRRGAQVRSETYVRVVQASETALHHIGESRQRAVNNLRAAWQQIQSDVQARLSPLLHLLRGASEGYKSELRKAGVKAP
jgi:hypothetical protein